MGLLFFYFSEVSQSFAQEARLEGKVEEIDSFSLPKNPKKATILSAILPGAGQVYNDKAWKVPILYAGIITDVYFIGFNNKRYQAFRGALIAFDEGEPNQFPTLNRDGLVRNVNYWKTNRDLCYLLLGAIYALNLVDANVDAHLSGFDITDDLSMKIEPHVESFSVSSRNMGFAITLSF